MTWGEAAASHLRGGDDAVMAMLVDRLPAMPPASGDALFRSLLNAIVGQQISGRAADTIIGQIIALLGDATPHAVMAARDEDLRGCGLSGAKQRALQDLAARILDGRLDLCALAGLPDEGVAAQLIAVRGIGRWTVDMFLIFGLGRPDVLPVGDYGLRAGARRLYGLETLPGAAELQRLARPWHPYASAATWYIWRYLDTPLRDFPDERLMGGS